MSLTQNLVDFETIQKDVGNICQIFDTLRRYISPLNRLQILTKPWPNFEQTLSKLWANFEQTLTKPWPNFEQTLIIF